MIDFMHMFSDYGIDYRHENDAWVQVECPICRHSGTRGYKGGFNLNGGYFYCWSCGGHRIETALIALLGIRYDQVSDLLSQYSDGTTPINKSLKKTGKAKSVALPMNELNERGRKYLLKRKFDPEYIHEKYGVSGTMLTGFWAYRIFIPIHFNKQLISFQARSTLSKEKCKELKIQRYLNLPVEESVVNPKTVLYNIDNCKKDWCALVEGPTDVWRFGNDCCATLGTSTSIEQHILLAERFKTVYIIFDNEKEAQERATKLGYALLMENIHVEIINHQLNHDMGDMAEKEIRQFKKELDLG